jgi:hypothetical protein
MSMMDSRLVELLMPYPGASLDAFFLLMQGNGDRFITAAPSSAPLACAPSVGPSTGDTARTGEGLDHVADLHRRRCTLERITTLNPGGLRRVMMSSAPGEIEVRLASLGLDLPPAVQAPAGARLPFAFVRIHGVRALHLASASQHTAQTRRRQSRRSTSSARPYSG